MEALTAMVGIPEQGQALRCIASAGLYTDVADHTLALKGGQVHRHRAHAGDLLLQLHWGTYGHSETSSCYAVLMPGLLQVDVTSKTEGRAFADATGVPLLVKYDTRLKENVAKNIVQDVTNQVQVRAHHFTALQKQLVLLWCQASLAWGVMVLRLDPRMQLRWRLQEESC